MQQEEQSNNHFENEAEEIVYKFNTYYNKEFVHSFQLGAKDTLFEIKQLQSDSLNLIFVPDFEYEFRGKVLDACKGIEKILDLENQDEFNQNIVSKSYDENLCLNHLQKQQVFIDEPAKFLCTQNLESQYNFGKLELFSCFNKNIKELNENTFTELHKPDQILDSKTFNKNSKKNNNINLTQVLSNSILQYRKLSYDKSYNPLKMLNSTELPLVKDLIYSGWNPPVLQRKICGDFFYVRVVTCEEQIFHITAFGGGFFINKSDDTKYDPKPVSKAYKSLNELLSENSEVWNTNFNLIMSKSNKLNVFDVENMDSKKPARWIEQQGQSEIQKHTYNTSRATFHMNDLYGLNPKVYRDWNEEMFNFKTLPYEMTMEKVNRMKLTKRLQSDFLEAAYLGAKAIVENKLMPFNYVSPKIEQCYIFNNIFYTWAYDDYLLNCPTLVDPNTKDILNNLKDITTNSCSNNDLRNLNLLVQADLKDINTINTVIVDYMGHRLLCQSMIPGILGCEQKTWAKHGCIDDSKTIVFDSNFNDALKKICEYFQLNDSIMYADKDNKMYDVAGPIEVKGVKGYDNRMFIYDLMRLSPRDLNYVKNDANPGATFESFLLRNELIHNYMLHTKITEIQKYREKKYKDYVEALEKKSKEQTESIQVEDSKTTDVTDTRETVIFEEPTKEIKNDQKDMALTKETLETEDSKKEVLSGQQEVDEKLQNNPFLNYNEKEEEEVNKMWDISMKLNPSQYTSFEPYYDTEKPEDVAKKASEIEEQKKQSNFLEEHSISKFISDWHKTKPFASDNKDITAMFHTYGINMRYLGNVLKKATEKLFPNLNMVLCRVIFVRSLKHFINEALRECSTIDQNATLARIFNLIFSDDETLLFLTESCNKLMSKRDPDSKKPTKSTLADTNETGENGESKISKRKRQKQNKKKKEIKDTQTLEIEESFNKYLVMTPEEFFERITTIAAFKYGYVPGEQKAFHEFSWMETKSCKISFLRDICLSIGLTIAEKEYKLAYEKKINIEYIFKPTDFITLNPKVKYVTAPNLNEFKEALENAYKMIREKNVTNAMIHTFAHLSLLTNMFGVFNEDTIEYASLQANLMNISKKNNESIEMFKVILKIQEKMYGMDNNQTIETMRKLAKNHSEQKNYAQAIQLLLRSQYLYDLVGGDLNLNSICQLDELHILYYETKAYENSIRILEDKLRRVEIVYKSNPEYYINIQARISLIHYETQNKDKCVSYIVKKLEVLIKVSPADAAISKEARSLLEYFQSNKDLSKAGMEDKIKYGINIGSFFSQKS